MVRHAHKAAPSKAQPLCFPRDVQREHKAPSIAAARKLLPHPSPHPCALYRPLALRLSHT